MIRRLLCFAAAATLPVGTMSAATAAPIKPTGPWVVAYENGMCLLQRSYGTAPQPLTLSFRQVPTMPMVEMFVLDRHVGVAPADQAVVTIGAGAPVRAPLSTYRTKDGASRYMEAAVSRASIDRGGAAGHVALAAGGVELYSFATPGLAKAMAQVDKCAADQLVAWGLNPAQVAATGRFPVARDDGLLADNDFVIDTPGIGSGGQNVAYVMVDPNGAPTRCAVAVPSGNATLDQASCDVLLSLRYRPAMGRDGRAMGGLFAHSFNWRAGI